jgi:hypothetical protein
MICEKNHQKLGIPVHVAALNLGTGEAAKPGSTMVTK